MSATAVLGATVVVDAVPGSVELPVSEQVGDTTASDVAPGEVTELPSESTGIGRGDLAGAPVDTTEGGEVVPRSASAVPGETAASPREPVPSLDKAARVSRDSARRD